jgi:hypothetical protein
MTGVFYNIHLIGWYGGLVPEDLKPQSSLSV